jgi:hypothetical protein
LVKQIRELLLVLVLAFIGVVSKINNSNWVSWLLILGVVVAIGIVHGRLRDQLGLGRVVKLHIFSRR